LQALFVLLHRIVGGVIGVIDNDEYFREMQ
jgi:hypothetical protein